MDVVEHLLQCVWPSGAVITLINVFSETALSNDQCSTIRRKIADNLSLLEASDFAPLLKQVMMFVEKYKTIEWVNLLRLVLRKVR
jgi:hypothetical protein